MIKGLLMTLRLLWLIVLITGALFYFHTVALPIKVHMYLGFAIAAVLLVIAVKGARASAGLAVATALVAILLPVIGILQLAHIGRPDLPYIQISHVVLGIAAIALGEISGKRSHPMA